MSYQYPYTAELYMQRTRDYASAVTNEPAKVHGDVHHSGLYEIDLELPGLDSALKFRAALAVFRSAHVELASPVTSFYQDAVTVTVIWVMPAQ